MVGRRGIRFPCRRTLRGGADCLPFARRSPPLMPRSWPNQEEIAVRGIHLRLASRSFRCLDCAARRAASAVGLLALERERIQCVQEASARNHDALHLRLHCATGAPVPRDLSFSRSRAHNSRSFAPSFGCPELFNAVPRMKWAPASSASIVSLPRGLNRLGWADPAGYNTRQAPAERPGKKDSPPAPLSDRRPPA